MAAILIGFVTTMIVGSLFPNIRLGGILIVNIFVFAIAVSTGLIEYL